MLRKKFPYKRQVEAMMKIIGWNVLFNTVLTIIFVMLNQWALQAQLEETFITLALFFGCIVIVGNALYVARLKNTESKFRLN